jgi:hypothetical protein
MSELHHRFTSIAHCSTFTVGTIGTGHSSLPTDQSSILEARKCWQCAHRKHAKLHTKSPIRLPSTSLRNLKLYRVKAKPHRGQKSARTVCGTSAQGCLRLDAYSLVKAHGQQQYHVAQHLTQSSKVTGSPMHGAVCQTCQIGPMRSPQFTWSSGSYVLPAGAPPSIN